MYEPKALHAIECSCSGDNRLFSTSEKAGVDVDRCFRYSAQACGVAAVHSPSVQGRFMLTSELTNAGGMLNARLRLLRNEKTVSLVLCILVNDS